MTEFPNQMVYCLLHKISFLFTTALTRTGDM